MPVSVSSQRPVNPRQSEIGIGSFSVTVFLALARKDDILIFNPAYKTLIGSAVFLIRGTVVF